VTKIGIVNTVSLNGGDAAILFAEIDALRRAWDGDVEFETFETDPLVAAKYNPWAKFVHRVTSPYSRGGNLPKGLRNSFRKRVQAWFLRNPNSVLAERLVNPRLKDLVRNAPKYDLVIGAGGTILVEQHPLKDRFKEMNFWLDRGIPMILYTQSMGPFKDSRNAQEMRSIADRCLHIFVRDVRSLENLLEIGVDRARIELAPDAVFGLANPKLHRTQNRGERPKIAISVRNWTRYKEGNAAERVNSYKETMATAAVHCVSHLGADVTFVSTCQGIPEYWNNDALTATEVIDQIPAEFRSRVALDDRYRAPDEMIKLLAGFDAVVATRMHMAILSFCAGTPALGIAYEFKTTELFAGLGIPQWSESIESLDPTTLCEAINRMWAERHSVMQNLVPTIEKEKENALEVGRKVRRLIEENRGEQNRQSS
jgi:colanic acid/amylovoran biosynthesis protein